MIRFTLPVTLTLGFLLLPLHVHAAETDREAIVKKVEELLDQLHSWQQKIRKEFQPDEEPAADEQATPAYGPVQPPAASAARQPEVVVQRRPAVRRPERKRVIVQLRHVPAVDVANTVTDVLQREATQGRSNSIIAPHSLGNSLIVSTLPDELPGVLELIESLDRQPPMVAVRLRILEMDQPDLSDNDEKWHSFIAGLQGTASDATRAGPSLVDLPEERVERWIQEAATAEQLACVVDTQIVALDQQPVFIKTEEKVPRSDSGNDGRSRDGSVDFLHAGFVLGLTPRITPEGLVTMEIDVERHGTGGKSPQSPGRAAREKENTIQATIAVQSGRTAVLAGLSGRTSQAESHLLVFITPIILK
jgi:type II secretory pathway component GspD/PulD (secretin)